MLSLIRTETLKLKRRPVVLFALLSSACPPVINMLYTFNLPENSGINAAFKDFYQSGFTFTEWILLPCVLGMLGSMLLIDERENGTLKELMMIPVNKALLLLSKLSVLLAFSVLFVLSTAIFTVAGALAVGYPDMTAVWILRLFEIYAKTGVLTALSITPIVFIAAAGRRGYILPACATLIYAISGFILASEFMGIHPLASIAGIVWRRDAGGPETSAGLMPCILNIAAVSLLSFAASVVALKKQDY